MASKKNQSKKDIEDKKKVKTNSSKPKITKKTNVTKTANTSKSKKTNNKQGTNKKTTKATTKKQTTKSNTKNKTIVEQSIITTEEVKETKKEKVKKEKKKIDIKSKLKNVKDKIKNSLHKTFKKSKKDNSKQNKKNDSKKKINKEKVKKEKFNIKNIFSKKNKDLVKFKKEKSINKVTIFKRIEVSFNRNPKKWFLTITGICALTLLVELGFFIKYRIDIEKKTIYYDSLNSVIIDDTNIIAVGSSNFKYSKHNSYTKGLEKGKLIKYDKNGEVLFEAKYDKGINTTFNSVISVEDGYIVVGSGEFSEEEKLNGGREAIILKYDKQGNLVWEKFYQVVTNTRFNKVIATTDGYIAVGQSIYANMEMGNHTTGGGIIVKYDFDGNEVWHNNHGGMKSGNFNDIVEVEGNFYVVGKDGSDSANIVKFDAAGKYLWHKNYRYTDGVGFTGVAYLDNALYAVGSKKVLPEGTTDEDDRTTTNTDALLVKYNLEGKVEFEKTFGGSNYERYNSIVMYRNDLIAVGHITSKDAGVKIETDGELMTGLIIRYDKNGNILKKEVLGGSNNDSLTDIITDGASLYITGYSNSKDGNILTSKNNGKDYFGKMIKLNSKFKTLLIK